MPESYPQGSYCDLIDRRYVEHPLPEAYQPRAVVEVDTDSPGWLCKFECGHIVWCAVPAKVGDMMYCAVCLNDFADQQLGRTKA